jgi:hypothetical protein
MGGPAVPHEEDWFTCLGVTINAGCAFAPRTDWSMAQWAFTYHQLVACILLTLTPLLRNKATARKHCRAVVPARRWGRIAAAGGGVVVVLVATAIVVGILPRPTGSTLPPPSPVAAAASDISVDHHHPALAANQAPIVPAEPRPAAVQGAAIPTVAKTVPVDPTPGYTERLRTGGTR